MRVLVTEDEPAVRLAVRVCLQLEGFDVVEACDGHEAMSALVEGGPFDALVADVMMPGVHGLDLVRAVRDSARFGELPIVLLTALGREGDVTAGLGAGADAYVTKPFDPSALVATLRKAIGRSPELRAAQRELERVGRVLVASTAPTFLPSPGA